MYFFLAGRDREDEFWSVKNWPPVPGRKRYSDYRGTAHLRVIPAQDAARVLRVTLHHKNLGKLKGYKGMIFYLFGSLAFKVYHPLVPITNVGACEVCVCMSVSVSVLELLVLIVLPLPLSTLCNGLIYNNK